MAMLCESADDLDFDFPRSLPSGLHTALNIRSSTPNDDDITSLSSRDSSTASGSDALHHEEQGISRRPSMNIVSNRIPFHLDGSRPRSRLHLTVSHLRQLSTKWTFQMAGSWRRNRGLREVFLSQILSALVNTATRILETEDEPLPPFSLLFLRMAVTMVLGIGHMWFRNTPSMPWGERRDWGLLHLRGVLGLWAIVGFLYSLKYLPLSDATVLTFLAPSVTGYTSHLLLHDPFTKSQQIASFVALLGVLLIARPSSFFADGAADTRLYGSSSMDNLKVKSSSMHRNVTSTIVSTESTSSTQRLTAVGIALLGVLGSGGSLTIIRSLGTRTSPVISLNYFATYSTVFAGISLLFGARMNFPELSLVWPSSLWQCSLLLFIGVVGFTVQLLLASGIAHERSNRATDMIYTNMLWALVMDRLVFGRLPGWSSVTGSFLIVGSAIFAFAAGENSDDLVGIEEHTYSLMGGMDEDVVSVEEDMRLT